MGFSLLTHSRAQKKPLFFNKICILGHSEVLWVVCAHKVWDYGFQRASLGGVSASGFQLGYKKQREEEEGPTVTAQATDIALESPFP